MYLFALNLYCIKTARFKRERALSNIQGRFNPFLRFHIVDIYLLELLERDFFFEICGHVLFGAENHAARF